MPRILRNLKINEVSGVDKGAGRGVKIMLMKRDEGDGLDWTAARKALKTTNKQSDDTALAALRDAITSIIEDDDVVNKADAVSESIEQFNEYIEQESDMADKDGLKITTADLTELVNKKVAEAVEPLKAEIAKRDDEIGLLKMTEAHKKFHDDIDGVDAKKAFAAMTPEQRDAHIEKKGKTTKRDDEVDKRFVELAKENSDLKKQVGEMLGARRQVEFSKRAIEVGLTEADGEIMRKAYDGDPEAQTALNKRFTETLKAAQAQAKTSVIFGEFGKAGSGPSSAYGELEAKAAELRKTDPKLSQAQAFSKAYTDPANAEIVQRDKQEQAQKLTKLAAGQQ